MAEPTSTFSESWYRVASQCLCLRPGVHARRQNYRGERWIVLEDPFSNAFFRLRPEAYEFVARLRPDRTVEEAWRECLDRFPDTAPGQESVIQLLSQLYFANLLRYDLAGDAPQLFERFRQRTQRELRARLLNIMFLRIPLLDPDRFLVRTLPVVGKLINPAGAALWVIVVGWALKVVADHFDAVKEHSQAVLAPENLFLLYTGLVVIKTIHEFGHAYFCRKFGGEVHVMGVMLMIFTPVPFMDATSSWSFRNRRHRVLVGAAGMIVELFFAGIATFVWAATAPGTLHSLAYNIMFVASVSTIIFNINPLLRFDGYYILSDLLEIPNLQQRANGHLRHLAESKLFGVKKSESPARTGKEAAWLTTFGITSSIYRVIVFGGILLLVADKFLILGLLMAAACAISWVTVPAVKFIQYLATNPRLDRVRWRAVGVSAGLGAAVILCLEVIPFPSHFRAPGVVRATQRTEIMTETAGSVIALLAPGGASVTAGQALLQLENPELELDLARTLTRAQEVEARVLKAMTEEPAALKPLQSLKESTQARLAKLRQDQERLTLRARHAGIWIAPGIENYTGRWVPRGTRLGLLINPVSFEFTATVPQEDADALFARPISGAQVRLRGQAGRALTTGPWKVIPAEQRVLPSAALGWMGGGEVATSPEDPQGRKAAEPFFEVHAGLPATGEVAVLDGRSGKIRFDLQSEPLLPRWLRRLWQLMQKRYQV